MRGAWIEIDNIDLSEVPANASPPVRGAWIEIDFLSCSLASYDVASREGGVD